MREAALPCAQCVERFTIRASPCVSPSARQRSLRLRQAAHWQKRGTGYGERAGFLFCDDSSCLYVYASSPESYSAMGAKTH